MRCEVSIGGPIEACQFQQSQLIREEEDHRCALEDLVESVSRLLYSSRLYRGLIDVQRGEDQVAAEAMADNDELLVDGLAGRIRNTGRARISLRLQNQLPDPIEYIESKRAQGQDSIGEPPVHQSG